jgi:phage N-6-adenine-methyltransferase
MARSIVSLHRRDTLSDITKHGFRDGSVTPGGGFVTGSKGRRPRLNAQPLTAAERARRYHQHKRQKARLSRLSVHFRSEQGAWETPQWLFDALHTEFHFTLDVCALPENAKCDHYFTPEQDNLQQPWRGVCYMNPPYGTEAYRWVQKAYEASLYGATVVCLLPACTDTRWWQHYVKLAAERRELPGRLRFVNAPHSAPFPSVVAIFRPYTH